MFRRMKNKTFREIYRNIKPVIQTTFKTLLIIFLLLLLVQQFDSNLIDRYISMDYFLVVILVLGTLTIATGWGGIWGEQPKEALTQKEYGLIFLLGTIGAVLIWYKLDSLGAGGVAYVVSVLSGAIIIVLSLMIMGWDLGDQLGGVARGDGRGILEEGVPKEPPKEPGRITEGYCVKCKAKRKMTNAQYVILKNGRRAKKGFCSVCGSAMYKMGR